MRIVGGTLKGRQLSTLASLDTRPTSDRVREGIASALEARNLIREANVLDLFSGTGALAFEMLSRGAKHATLVDNSAKSLNVIKSNAANLQLSASITTIRHDLSKPLTTITRNNLTKSGVFDLIFLDPPYADIALVPHVLESLFQRQFLSPLASIVIEYSTAKAPIFPSFVTVNNTYRYGGTSVSLATVITSKDEL